MPSTNTVYKDKSFEFVVKTPPAAVQLMEAAKLKSVQESLIVKKVASVTWEQIRAIAEDKMPDLNAFTTEAAMSMVVGTAKSMGITVSGDSF
jgi:large subunit ribosomal protein L11